MGSLVPSTPAITVLEEQRLGYHGLSLSNWTTTGVPQIIGNVEVAGALYTFPALETITGIAGIADGATAYVKLVISGSSIGAQWTSVAPVWSDEKQGWYISGTAERVVFSATKTSATVIANKTKLSDRLVIFGDDWRSELSSPHKARFGITKITSGSGNFTVPSGVYAIRVACVGGGGGGGGGADSAGGGGGGGTAISDALFETLSVTPGQLIAYSVGAGGAGGAGGVAAGTNGSNGGNSSFGGATTGIGGGGGGAGGTLGGSGGIGGGSIAPSAGSNGVSSIWGGTGGGAGGAGGAKGGVGGVGGYGGGGGGGGESRAAGGNGGSGIIIVEW